MRYPVRLFLGNEEVEFSTPPDILFNYSVTELSNPTIVKNAYSKTVTIEGTAQNNRIFGHIYNLERIQGFGGTISGEGFNPLVRLTLPCIITAQFMRADTSSLMKLERTTTT